MGSAGFRGVENCCPGLHIPWYWGYWVSVRLFRVWAAVHSGCQSGRFSGRFREQTGYSGPCRALSGSSINRPGRGPERPGLGPAEQERGRPEVPQNQIWYHGIISAPDTTWASGCLGVLWYTQTIVPSKFGTYVSLRNMLPASWRVYSHASLARSSR